MPVSEPVQSQQEQLSISDLKFDLEAISKAFSKLRPDKAMGPDGLASMLVQDLITYPLYLLFKKSLRDTVIPDDWKQAVVTPIFKKGNRNKTKNYRPVSLTSIIMARFVNLLLLGTVLFSI